MDELTIIAAGAVARFAGVTSAYLQATAGQAIIGVSQTNVQAGQRLRMRSDGSETIMIAGATITAGQQLQMGDAGRVIPLADGFAIGRAVVGSTAGGAVVVWLESESPASAMSQADVSGTLAMLAAYEAGSIGGGSSSMGNVFLVPSEQPYGVAFDSTGNQKVALQAALDAAVTPAISGVVWGRGKTVAMPAGVVLSDPGLVMSRRIKIAGTGGRSSTTLRTRHNSVVANGYMLSIDTVADASGSVDQRPVIEGISLQGQLQASAASAHAFSVGGIYVPSPAVAGRQAPLLRDVLIAEHKGDGLVIDPNSDGLQASDTYILANAGWGLRAEQCNDAKLTNIGIGRNTKGQVWLKNCHSFSIVNFDFWPSRGTGLFLYTGDHTLVIEGSNQCGFSNGQIEGPVRITGDNEIPGGTEQYMHQGNSFSNVQFCVEEGIMNSPNWPASLNHMLLIEDSSGTKISNAQFRYLRETPSTPELNATPDYIFEFADVGSNPSLVASRKGTVFLSSTQLYHSPGAEAESKYEVVPFKKNVVAATDRSRLVFMGDYPGMPKLCPTAAIPNNCLSANGSSKVIGYYKLLWCMLDPTRDLSTATLSSTFALPDWSAVPAPSGYTWCVVAR